MNSLEIDLETSVKVDGLAIRHFNEARDDALVFEFRRLEEMTPADLALNDEVVIAAGVEYFPSLDGVGFVRNKGTLSHGQGKITGIYYENSENGKVNDRIAMIEIVIDGQTCIVNGQDKLVKATDIYEGENEVKAKFTETVKEEYERKLSQRLERERELLVILESATRDAWNPKEAVQLGKLTIFKPTTDEIKEALQNLAWASPLKTDPDLSFDLNLRPTTYTLDKGDVIPLGVDILTKRTRIFVIDGVEKKDGALVSVKVELREIQINYSRNQVMLYSPEFLGTAVLPEDKVKELLKGKIRFRYLELEERIQQINENRSRALYIGALRGYVKALCKKLGK